MVGVILAPHPHNCHLHSHLVLFVFSNGSPPACLSQATSRSTLPDTARPGKRAQRGPGQRGRAVPLARDILLDVRHPIAREGATPMGSPPTVGRSGARARANSCRPASWRSSYFFSSLIFVDFLQTSHGAELGLAVGFGVRHLWRQRAALHPHQSRNARPCGCRMAGSCGGCTTQTHPRRRRLQLPTPHPMAEPIAIPNPPQHHPSTSARLRLKSTFFTDDVGR